jgi:hypothetical protein
MQIHVCGTPEFFREQGLRKGGRIYGKIPPPTKQRAMRELCLSPRKSQLSKDHHRRLS